MRTILVVIYIIGALSAFITENDNQAARAAATGQPASETAAFALAAGWPIAYVVSRVHEQFSPPAKECKP